MTVKTDMTHQSRGTTSYRMSRQRSLRRTRTGERLGNMSRNSSRYASRRTGGASRSRTRSRSRSRSRSRAARGRSQKRWNRQRSSSSLLKVGQHIGKTIVGAHHVWYWTDKENRQYEAIKFSLMNRGNSEPEATRIAAATVNARRRDK